MKEIEKPKDALGAAVASKKRCGTCIDRKISCDRRLPRCSNCIRSNRICQGYGLRLSWPRDDDRKRLVVSQVVSCPSKYNQHARQSKQLHMVNATSWDLEVHHVLTMSRQRAIAPTLRRSLTWSLSGIATGDKDLFQYFQNSMLLRTFSEQPLGEILIRIAISEDSRAGVAVQRALLALSALHRYGFGFRAEELKLSALRALAASAADGIEAEGAVQHVAAGMILFLFETLQHSDSSSQWLWYLSGARKVINSVSVERFCGATGASALLEWVYYHEVLARFGMRHWIQSDTRIPRNNVLGQVPDYLPNGRLRLEADVGTVHAQKPFQNKQLFEPLRLLSEVAAVVLPPRDPRAQTHEYKSRIMQLRKDVESAAIPNSFDPSLPQAQRGAAAKAEIYRLSTLTYLNRATGDNLMQPSEISALVDRGFEILGLMRVCERSFPLLILGCEARTDSERLLVLELISQTETTPPLRDLDCIRTLLHAIWTQDDLHAEQDLKIDYFEKLAFVISSSEVIPSFV